MIRARFASRALVPSGCFESRVSWCYRSRFLTSVAHAGCRWPNVREHPTTGGDQKSSRSCRSTGDGRIALCAVSLPDGERVSFTGVLACRPDSDVCDVQIDEAGVAAVPGAIPRDRISFFIMRS